MERLTSLLRSLRALAMQYPGFEGGMFWFSEEQSRRLVMMSHWSTLEAWDAFKRAPGTTQVFSNVAVLLSRPLRERHFSGTDDLDLSRDV